MKNILLALSASLFITGLFVPLKLFGLSKTFSDPRLYIALSIISLLIHFKNELNSKIILLEKILPAIIAGIFLHSILYKFLSWKGVQVSGYDFAHYDYAIWNISSGNGPLLSISNENFYFQNVFGSHFRPILYLFAIPQFFIKSHFYVFFLQTLSTLFSLLVLSKICEKIFPGKTIIKLLFVVGFSFNLYYLSVFKFVFQAETFYIPLSILLIYFLQKKHTIGLIASSILFLSIKEDAPLLLLSVWGMYTILGKTKKTTIIGLLAIILCSLYYVIATKFLMPHWQIRPESSFVALWGKYGSSMVGIVQGALLNPHLVLQDIFTNKSLYLLLLSLGFMPVLTPLILAATISVVILTTADYPQLNRFGVYYAAYVIGFFYISAIYGVKKFKKHQTIITSLVVLSGMLMGLGKYSLPKPNFALSNEIKEMNKYIDPKCDHIYASGNIIPVIDYYPNLRRISDIDDAISNSCQIILLKSINSIPMTVEESTELYNAVKSKFSSILYESENIIFARK